MNADTRQSNDDARPLPGASRWRPFVEARELVRRLGLKNQKEWHAWCSSGERPVDIPPAPERAYPGEWLGLRDWLGTGKPRRQTVGRCLEARSFIEARVFVHGLGLTSHAQWRAWARTNARPKDIPGDPYHAYQDSGWNGWSDWLGTGLRKRTFGDEAFRPFAEARDFAREKRFRLSDEWKVFARSRACPADIPVDPDRRYQDKGWCGWSDWLGHRVGWKLNDIRAFLASLSSVIHDLQPVELYSILSRNGLLGVDRRNSNMKMIEEIERLCSAQDKASEFERLARMVGAPVANEESSNDDELCDLTVDCLQQPSELPLLRSLDSLKALDHLVHTGLSSDEEVLEFLIDNRVSMLWQQFLDDNPGFSLERLRAESGGTYFERIRQRFDEQYEGAMNLVIPQEYSFQRDGKRVEPNLMQRLAAYRLLKDRRVGNWSGVGAGKTISAVLSSRVLDAHLTVIVAVNATLKGWEKAIRQVFPDSVVIVKMRDDLTIDPAAYTYLIVNFEQFQQKWSRESVEGLTDHHKIDFIVVDEIQFVKKRRETSSSNRPDSRREIVRSLIVKAGMRNQDLRVLGMSATPVMSSLSEATSLLELITGVPQDDLATSPTISNAVRVHQRLIRHGIRYRPQYKLSLKTEYPIWMVTRASPCFGK